MVGVVLNAPLLHEEYLPLSQDIHPDAIAVRHGHTFSHSVHPNAMEALAGMRPMMPMRTQMGPTPNIRRR